ncbi:unnamed protein product [Notodromas monacha]|uniref:Brix domain-containing protein n=1 Tax=Notodromas monacha TaxID=399045 RepID=A0A7R9BJL2_9CRUS|nr:unnamed protein product [Notodromas monacha]CAG0915938.1 unnamed protein product [Notodromas monacha]
MGEEISPRIRKSGKSKKNVCDEESLSKDECVVEIKEEDAQPDVVPDTQRAVVSKTRVFRTIHSRRKVMANLKLEKRKDKKERQKERREERERLGKKAPPKLVPRTIESTRETDHTVLTGDAEEDAEVLLDEEADEMASYFQKEAEPKVLVTTSEGASSPGVRIAKDLSRLIPNAEFFFRKKTSIKGTVEKAKLRGYTDVMIVHESHKKCDGFVLIHLPNGPTAHFKMSSMKTTNMLRHHWESIGNERPEIILNNFSTKLGHRVARMLASLFHYDPEFKGRRVVTFHNQRDFIFFRQHRYEFKSGQKVALRELGPRFTLKLRWLQRGTFDTKHGEYEWIHRRGEMDTSRRRFHL